MRLPEINRYLDRIAPTPLVPVRLDENRAADLVQARVLESKRVDQGPDRRVHPGQGPAPGRDRAGWNGRRGLERLDQHRHGARGRAARAAICRRDARGSQPRAPADHRGLRRRGRVHGAIRGHHGRPRGRGPRSEGAGRLPAAPVLQSRQSPRPPSADRAGGHCPDPRRHCRRGRQRRRDGGTLVGLWEGFTDHGCDVAAFAARPVAGLGMDCAECCSFSGRIPGVADGLSAIYAAFQPGSRVELDVPDDEALQTARRLIKQRVPRRAQLRPELPCRADGRRAPRPQLPAS